MMMSAEELGLPGLVISYAPQGTLEWFEARRGAITGSKARECRETVIVQRGRAAKPAKVDKKTGEVLEEGQPEVPELRGPSSAARLYAMNCAREREGGRSLMANYQNAAMREGQKQEPEARVAYEVLTGSLVEEAGFIRTEDGRFGVSVDGLRFELDEKGQPVRGAVEFKTMVSSDTLFTSMVLGDVSDYEDQCLMEMWLLHLDWIDLCLWAPDLPEQARLKVIRIERDEARIEALVEDLMKFDQLVEDYRVQLRRYVASCLPIPDATESDFGELDD